MRRRPRLAAIVTGLVVLATAIAGQAPSDSALGADPLAEAQANQRALQQSLASQQRELASLKSLSATLDAKLAAAEAELARVGAEYERVAGLLVQVELQVAEVQARLEAIRARIARLDEMLVALAIEVERQNTRARGARDAAPGSLPRRVRAEPDVVARGPAGG